MFRVLQAVLTFILVMAIFLFLYVGFSTYVATGNMA